MCFGMGCRYERKGTGPDAGECSLSIRSGHSYPDDAACMWKPEDEEEFEDAGDGGAFVPVV